MTDLQMTGRQTWWAWWSILVQHDCNESPHEGDAKGKARQNEDKATGLHIDHGLAFHLWHRIREGKPAATRKSLIRVAVSQWGRMQQATPACCSTPSDFCQRLDSHVCL